jgi:hypothetical protein
MAAWWKNDHDGRATSLSFLVKPQSGLTSKLTPNPPIDDWLTAGIDGPYRRCKEDIGDYG